MRNRNNNRFTTVAKSSVGEEKPLSVIIPVAGIGHRMKSYGPKCLLSVDGRYTILDNIIRLVRNTYENCEIIVCVGFEADKVISSLDKDIRVVENQMYTHTNTVESLRLALNNKIHDDVLIIYGDLVFNSKTIQNTSEKESYAIVDSGNNFDKNDVGLTIVDESITSFAYGLDVKWAQIVFLTGRELKLFHRYCSDRSKSKLYAFEILNMVLRNGGKIKSYEPANMKIKEIDSVKDLHK